MSLFKLLYNIGKRLQGDTFDLTYGRKIFIEWAQANHANHPLRILDIGSGTGDDLVNIANSMGVKCELFAVEGYPEYQQICQSKGIQAFGINIERDALPWPDQYFDIVVINQVLEHTKDCYFVVSEISRVLKTDAKLWIGIPNLAAWHDRLALLIGGQPTCIKIPGPHVRGFTKSGFIQFIECLDFFKVTKFAGSGFLPFPRSLAILFAKLFPNLSTSIFFECQRTSKSGKFIEVLDIRFYQTDFYRGS